MAEDRPVPGSVEDPVAVGHFTTMQMRGGKVQGRDLHLLRLRQASGDLWGVGTDKGMLLRAIREGSVRAGPMADCTLRVCVRPAEPGASPGGGSAARPLFNYDCAEPTVGVHRPLRVEVGIEPARVVPAAPLRVRSHRGLRDRPIVKHLALDAQYAMLRDAQAAGYDDVLLVAPDGRIAEGSFWTVAFWDGGMVTWPQAPALAGVTWRLLQRALDDAGIPQQRVPMMLGELEGQRAAFAVNSSGIRDIVSVDTHVLPGDARFGAALRALLAAVPWGDL